MHHTQSHIHTRRPIKPTTLDHTRTGCQAADEHVSLRGCASVRVWPRDSLSTGKWLRRTRFTLRFCRRVMPLTWRTSLRNIPSSAHAATQAHTCKHALRHMMHRAQATYIASSQEPPPVSRLHTRTWRCPNDRAVLAFPHPVPTASRTYRTAHPTSCASPRTARTPAYGGCALVSHDARHPLPQSAL